MQKAFKKRLIVLCMWLEKQKTKLRELLETLSMDL